MLRAPPLIFLYIVRILVMHVYNIRCIIFLLIIFFFAICSIHFVGLDIYKCLVARLGREVSVTYVAKTSVIFHFQCSSTSTNR